MKSLTEQEMERRGLRNAADIQAQGTLRDFQQVGEFFHPIWRPRYDEALRELEIESSRKRAAEVRVWELEALVHDQGAYEARHADALARERERGDYWRGQARELERDARLWRDARAVRRHRAAARRGVLKER